MPSPVTPYPYYPPRTLNRTQTQVVREVDPDWRPAMSGKETLYVFSNGRRFSDTPKTSGIYADD